MNDWPALAFECHYSVKTMAGNCGVKVRALRVFCKRTLYRTAKQWLRELRLAKAEEWLLAGNSTKLIARLLGYTDAAHFCHEFKHARGISAQAWREREWAWGMGAGPRPIRLPKLPLPKKFPDERDFPWLGFG